MKQKQKWYTENIYFIVLVQMLLIQRKQLSETNVTSHAFQHISDFEDLSWMLSRATENGVVGHMWPAGL